MQRPIIAMALLGLSAAPLSTASAEPSESPRADGSAPPLRQPAGHHPEPRVIVTVSSVRGPHERREVERAARAAWAPIVKCHKSIDRQARGLLRLELVVASDGKVADARRTSSTLKRPQLAACLTTAMKRVFMPTAASRSIASLEIRLAPGDP
jgi:hypothetical protein